MTITTAMTATARKIEAPKPYAKNTMSAPPILQFLAKVREEHKVLNRKRTTDVRLILGRLDQAEKVRLDPGENDRKLLGIHTVTA